MTYRAPFYRKRWLYLHYRNVDSDCNGGVEYSERLVPIPYD